MVKGISHLKRNLCATRMPMKWISVLLLLQLSGHFSPGSCGKVLVWPTEYSHWINMKTILDALVQRGHQVTVLTSSASILVDPNKPSAIQFEVFPTSLTKDDFEDLFKRLTSKWTYTPKDTFWTYFSLMQDNTCEYFDCIQKLCKDAVLNKNLMTKLQESRFDVVLADPAGPCGELLAELLKIPFVYSLRFSFGYTIEKYSGGLPFPPSYVPIVLSELSDQMTFMERVKNMMYVLYFDFWFQTFSEKWDQLCSKALGRPTTLFELIKKAEIWLIRTYWDFEFPRPLLPHFQFVGGLHCKPAKPLPKVIWRYDGKKPDTLGPNTRLYKWIPQNDLLGHPKTKAFITHGGTNGIYEAIYHGIPMVGLPMFAEQPDNIVHMKTKGAAVRLDFNTISSTDLLNALKTVINDPSYKENAMKLSRIHHDQPVKPLDQAVFWIEFVMRHKGAKHLRPAAHDLTWFQYHSLDVIGFLLACVATATFVITKCVLFCCQKFFKTGKKKKRE
ncbi:PREDICTED: UDP-glucuronosyltransferase 2B31-like isoform X2 [Myotis davidii]|uniref:UDP-glucuronosyltransferase 2B31-like isoform X2 n=1 Tax=Myotis davidii TaxID=225400 RepID=UPI0007677CCE|nr:PREDICTED: UDP-glucuronosyltransferase 2B31-like isoform X2 [Myotis davidii]